MSKKLQKSLTDYNATLVKEGETLLGDLGATIGGRQYVSVPGRASYVYVRLRTKLSELIQAFNDKVAQKYGVPVIVKRQGNRYVVVERNTETFSDWETNDPYIPQHAPQHIFDKDGGNMGGDPVWVYPYQFMPSLVSPFGSRKATNVFIQSYPLVDTNGDWKYCGNTGTEKLTKYNPTSGSCFVLITLDTVSGNPVCFATTGTYIPLGITGTSQIIPYLPNVPSYNYLPEAAILLVSGTTGIGWSQIYDVRQFLSPHPTGSSYLSINNYPGINTIIINGVTFSVTGSSAFLDIVAGGGAGTSGIILTAEGRLETGTNVLEPYLVTSDMVIDNVYLYCENLGQTGTTRVDIKSNGISIFSGSERIILDYAYTGTYTTKLPYRPNLYEGDVLTLDINEKAINSQNMMTVLNPTSGSGGGSLTVEQSGGAPSVVGVDKIVVDGMSVTDNGSGQVTIKSADYVLVRDEKTLGTHGGTFTSGAWRTRDINTEVSDAGNHCSISINQITLDAGTYECKIKVPALRVDNHQAKLYNITDAADELIGSTENTVNAGSVGDITSSWIMGRFTILSSKVFEIQHQGTTTYSTYGFGLAASFSTEIYTIAEFWKVA